MIPKVIVQTHRNQSVGAEYRKTWLDQNPGFEYRFFDDNAVRDFLVENMPRLVSVYDKLPHPVQRADLFRYAYVYQCGGVYSDVDTICEASLASYIDFNQDALVVGIEMSPGDYKFGLEQYTRQYTSPFQVLQWTFASSPKHPALATMLDRIRFYVNTLTVEQLQSWSRVDRFTLELTGPMMFSQVVFDCLSGARQGKVELLGQSIWGYNPWHNHSISETDETIKVRHLFHGSWKQAQS